jgi:hypothetical protein
MAKVIVKMPNGTLITFEFEKIPTHDEIVSAMAIIGGREKRG